MKLKGKKLYQIIVLKNNESIELISSHFNLSTVQQKYYKMLEDNKKIVFPRQYINDNTINETNYHLAIIKRKTDSDITNPKFQNQYGAFVEHKIIDNDDWVLLEKDVYNYEETFWVYGYNPRYYRKDFMFIYNNLIKSVMINKNNFLSISVFKNKLVFEGLDNVNMVICKNKNDARRMHDLLDDFCKVDKLKNVLFCGDCSKINRLFKTIQNLTNWNYKKIMRNTT